MSFTIVPARKGKNAIFLGLAGPAKSGKTLSALRIAKGLGGKVVVIDTENKRSLHYADKFDFHHLDFQAPYSPARYIEAVDAAIAAGGKVIIIDSASHEWEGEGGILQMREAEFKKMGYKDSMQFTSWIAPKAENNKFVNHLLKLNTHFILCFRAKDGMLLEKNDKGKIEPRKLGWVPICGDRLDFEMTALLVLPPNSKGTPDMAAKGMLMPYYMKTILGQGQLTEDTGKALAEWAGSTPPSGKADTPTDLDTAPEETTQEEETTADRPLDDEPESPAETDGYVPPVPVPEGVDPAVWRQACSFAEDGKERLQVFLNTVTEGEWNMLKAHRAALRGLFPKVSA